MTTLRFKMVEEAIGRKAVEVKAPAERPAEYFGKYVFDRDKMRKYLPKACFETLMNTMKNGSPLDRETADCVAAGMKQWAQDMGATHYTHSTLDGRNCGETRCFYRGRSRRRSVGRVHRKVADTTRTGCFQFSERWSSQYI